MRRPPRGGRSVRGRQARPAGVVDVPHSTDSDDFVNTLRRALGLRRTSLNRRPRRLLPAAVAVATLGCLALAGPASAFWTPQHGGSPNADSIHTLYVFTLVIAGFIFFGVEGALFYSLIKFKARKGAVAAQIRGNTRLEIGWTVGAAVILVVLAVATFTQLPGIRNPKNSGADGLNLASSGGGAGDPDCLGARQAPAAERQVAEHQGQRAAVHLALHLPRR